jgi:hypothetical protein
MKACGRISKLGRQARHAVAFERRSTKWSPATRATAPQETTTTHSRKPWFSSSNAGRRQPVVFVVVLVEEAARSQGRQVHLVNSCRGDGCRGDAEFGGNRVDRALGDVEVHPTVGGEMRTDVALVVLLRFLAG